jgi:hypothetical protein
MNRTTDNNDHEIARCRIISSYILKLAHDSSPATVKNIVLGTTGCGFEKAQELFRTRDDMISGITEAVAVAKKNVNKYDRLRYAIGIL